MGTVSVLYAEIEMPLNLLCDCINKPSSQRVSHLDTVLPFIVWLLAGF